MAIAILGWVVAAPTAAGAVPERPCTTYTYDAPAYDAPGAGAVSERDPPASRDRGMTYDTADLWSRGSLECREGSAASSTTTYDAHRAGHAQAAPATPTMGRQVGLADGDHSSLERSVGAAKSVDEAGALVKYDPMAASRNLLGQLGDGYAVTPGGRTISAHAAERIALGGPGRPPTTLARVDDILNNPTGIKYDPVRDTVKVMQGKDFVVVSGTGPQHIVTVMVR